MRKKIVAGNWKMNKTAAEAKELIADIRQAVADHDCPVEVVVCPPFTALESTAAALTGSQIALGAQNMNARETGAFTGEVSAAMLVALGVRYVILGHSERRALYGETDAIVNEKVRAALTAGLTPIVCVGETLAEREAGQMDAVVSEQVQHSLADVTGDELKSGKVVVAYEPVWAIGTGKTASKEQAQAMHALIRRVLAEMTNGMAAAAVRIQYGGSMKPGNAAELMAMPDIDGGLIGGAALQADSFAAIIKAGC